MNKSNALRVDEISSPTRGMLQVDRSGTCSAWIARSVWLLCTLLLTFTAGLAAGISPAAADDLADASELARAGAYRDASTLAAKVLEATPDNAGAARLIQDLARRQSPPADAKALIPAKASELVRRGLEARLLEPKQAAAALTTLLADESAPALFRLDLARALLAQEKLGPAESLVNEFLKRAPEVAEGHVLRGHVLAARGKHTAARTCYENALELERGLSAAAVPLADSLGEAGKDKDARGVLTEALAIYPRNPELLLGLAADQLRVGQGEEAVKTLLSIVPLEGAYLPLQARLGVAYRNLKMPKEAEASARKALQADKDSIDGLRTLGWVLQKKGDFPGALEQYEKVQGLRPKWPQAYVDIGFAKVMSEDRRGARTALEKALKLDKKHFDGNLKMGIYYYLGDDPKRAKKHLSVVLKKNDDHIPANRYMGYTLLREGKPKNALKHFEKISEQDEKDVDSVRMSGKALLQMGKLDDAVEKFRDAIARDDKDALSYFDLGKGLRAQEKWEDAEAAFRKAVALDATISHPNLYLAELIDEVQDDPEGALPFYKRYLELDGDDRGDAIQKRIDQIEADLGEKKK